ncbi:MAG: hypothetical protein J1E63_08420 [Muribaculaceae bacterium]|nr:hypothetical protein [Muribaculaceae bacterium]
MKKLSALLALAMATAVSCLATDLPFTVKAPTWTKVAIAKDPEGLNIRKSPSTSAPRLLVDELKITAYDVPLFFYGFWSSNAPKGTVYALKFTGPDPVVSESNGWLEIENIGPNMEENGWVSARYCNIVTPTPVTKDNKPSGDNFLWLSDKGIATGDDGEYALQGYYNEMDDEIVFNLGRLAAGKVVCPFSLYCSVLVDDSRKPGLVKDGDIYQITINPKLMNDDGYDISLTRFPVDLINAIIKAATESRIPQVIYNEPEPAY